MDRKASDQGWQLQTHVEEFLAQFLMNATQRIEYKPRFIVELLEMPSEYRKKEPREMTP